MDFKIMAASILAPGICGLEEFTRYEHARTDIGQGGIDLSRYVPQRPGDARRASKAAKIVAYLYQQMCAENPVPFFGDQDILLCASDEGTGNVCNDVMRQITTDHEVSPLTFTYSVHNAPLGYLTIDQKMCGDGYSVSMGLDTFPSALLSAVSLAHTDNANVMLIAYDVAPDSPFSELIAVHTEMAIGFLISADLSDGEKGAHYRMASVFSDYDLPSTAASQPGGVSTASALPLLRSHLFGQAGDTVMIQGEKMLLQVKKQ